jgi:hypothetical protein
MDGIRKTTLITVLLAAGSVLAAGERGPTPLDYWLTERGVVIHVEAVQTGVDGLARDMTIRIWNGGTTSLDGRLVFKKLKIYADVGPGGEEPHPVMSTFQAVDDTVSQTMAMQFYGGEIEREPQPFVDLQAPLVEGNSWEFEAALYLWSFGFEEKVTIAIESEIIATGFTHESPAGAFENCLRVRDKGRSVGNLRLDEGEYAGQAVFVTWDVERIWAPGLGSIAEVSRVRMSTVRRPIQLLRETHFASEIARVEGR